MMETKRIDGEVSEYITLWNFNGAYVSNQKPI